MSEQAREDTANRVREVRPKASGEHLSERDFETTYVAPRVFLVRGLVDQVERHERIVFCRQCIESGKGNAVKLRRLAITYEESMLAKDVIKCVAFCQCFHCAFEMHVPCDFDVRMEEYSDWDSKIQKLIHEQARQEALQRQMRDAAMAQSPNIGHGHYPGALQGGMLNPYSNDPRNALGNQVLGYAPPNGGPSSDVETQRSVYRRLAAKLGLDPDKLVK